MCCESNQRRVGSLLPLTRPPPSLPPEAVQSALLSPSMEAGADGRGHGRRLYLRSLSPSLFPRDHATFDVRARPLALSPSVFIHLHLEAECSSCSGLSYTCAKFWCCTSQPWRDTRLALQTWPASPGIVWPLHNARDQFEIIILRSALYSCDAD